MRWLQDSRWLFLVQQLGGFVQAVQFFAVSFSKIKNNKHEYEEQNHQTFFDCLSSHKKQKQVQDSWKKIYSYLYSAFFVLFKHGILLRHKL